MDCWHYSFKKQLIHNICNITVQYVFVCQSVYKPKCQVKGDVHSPQSSCDGIQQTDLLCVELPALTGHTVHTHQTVASIQQPGGTRTQTHNVLYIILYVCYASDAKR